MTASYESKKLLEEYLLLHYGEDEAVLPYSFGPKDALGFPARAVGQMFDLDSLINKTKALDLGCAVGRSSFELSAYFDQVLGIDFSASFIEAANRMLSEGEIAFEYIVEGELRKSALAKRPEKSRAKNLQFQVGDACNLDPQLGNFDAVLLANLICRLPEPIKLLERLPQLVAGGGQLVITSPYTWLEEHTPKDNWLGGFEASAGAVRSLEALKQHLSADFELVDVKELPFMIREHERKFQWSVSQATRWVRNPG